LFKSPDTRRELEEFVERRIHLHPLQREMSSLIIPVAVWNDAPRQEVTATHVFSSGIEISGKKMTTIVQGTKGGLLYLWNLSNEEPHETTCLLNPRLIVFAGDAPLTCITSLFFRGASSIAVLTGTLSLVLFVV